MQADTVEVRLSRDRQVLAPSRAGRQAAFTAAAAAPGLTVTRIDPIAAE